MFTFLRHEAGLVVQDEAARDSRRDRGNKFREVGRAGISNEGGADARVSVSERPLDCFCGIKIAVSADNLIASIRQRLNEVGEAVKGKGVAHIFLYAKRHLVCAQVCCGR